MTYSGSPNSYFRQLPDLDYPSLRNDRNSAYDYQIVKNIFKRAVLRDDVFDEVTAFTKYSIQGDERPDQVAYQFYNDAGLDWVVLTTNNIVHVRDEWPMGERDFLTYVNSKYTSEELSNFLVKNKIATRNDNFYAWRCLKYLGIDTNDGVVRLSMTHYNNLNDTEKLIDALKKI